MLQARRSVLSGLIPSLAAPELDRLLQRHDFDVQRAADAFFAGRWTAETAQREREQLAQEEQQWSQPRGGQPAGGPVEPAPPATVVNPYALKRGAAPDKDPAKRAKLPPKRQGTLTGSFCAPTQTTAKGAEDVMDVSEGVIDAIDVEDEQEPAKCARVQSVLFERKTVDEARKMAKATPAAASASSSSAAPSSSSAPSTSSATAPPAPPRKAASRSTAGANSKAAGGGRNNTGKSGGGKSGGGKSGGGKSGGSKGGGKSGRPAPSGPAAGGGGGRARTAAAAAPPAPPAPSDRPTASAAVYSKGGAAWATRFNANGGSVTSEITLEELQVLCCAVLCCAVLCFALMCCAVLCCAVLCCTTPAAL
jgi:hypothetical protein